MPQEKDISARIKEIENLLLQVNSDYESLISSVSEEQLLSTPP